MDYINEDSLLLIIGFLSLKDKVNLYLTNKSYQPFIRKLDLSLFSIEKKIPNHYTFVIKSGSELILAVNNNFIMYIEESSIIRKKIHPVFKIKDTFPSCINSCCREKRLGNIYIGLHRGDIPQYLRTMHYIKRKIPYCISCFNEWGIDSYLNHPQSKEKR